MDTASGHGPHATDLFAGKVAVITGAASGIGRAIAERCAREQIRVVLADVEEAPLAETERELRKAGCEALAVRADVSSARDVQRLADRAFEAFGDVHFLFNNAGVVGAPGLSVWETELEDWEWLLRVHVWGLIHSLRSFVPRMLERGAEGHIVNTASIVGVITGTGAYAVTKHSVVALSESLQRDLARLGAPIRVSVLCPSGVNTRILDAERNRPADLRLERPLTEDQQRIERELRREFQQAAPPSEVADALFDGLREGAFYILPHRDWERYIRRRAEAILKGSPPESPF